MHKYKSCFTDNVAASETDVWKDEIDLIESSQVIVGKDVLL